MSWAKAHRRDKTPNKPEFCHSVRFSCEFSVWPGSDICQSCASVEKKLGGVYFHWEKLIIFHRYDIHRSKMLCSASCPLGSWWTCCHLCSIYNTLIPTNFWRWELKSSSKKGELSLSEANSCVAQEVSSGDAGPEEECICHTGPLSMAYAVIS